MFYIITQKKYLVCESELNGRSQRACTVIYRVGYAPEQSTKIPIRGGRVAAFHSNTSSLRTFLTKSVETNSSSVVRLG